MAWIEWCPAGASLGSASAIAGEACPGLPTDLTPRVVLSDDLDVAVFDATIGGLVLDTEIGELEMAADNVEVVCIAEGSPIGLHGRVSRTVVAIQESLVLPFQLVVQDDSRHSTTLGDDARLLLFERPEHQGVVRQLARLHDTGVERLAGTVAVGTPVALKHRLALARQRDNPLRAGDVRQALVRDQPLMEESTQIAWLVEVLGWHDPERPDRGQAPHIRFVQQMRAVEALDPFECCPTLQTQVAVEEVGISGVKASLNLGWSIDVASAILISDVVV